jgi:hypothetical protein
MSSTRKLAQARSAQRRGAKSRLKPIVQGEVTKPVAASKVAVRKAVASNRVLKNQVGGLIPLPC